MTGGSSCLKCGQQPISYKSMPCGCPTLCTACAMKMATGGKCKACGAMFSELKQVAHARASSASADDANKHDDKQH